MGKGVVLEETTVSFDDASEDTINAIRPRYSLEITNLLSVFSTFD